MSHLVHSKRVRKLISSNDIAYYAEYKYPDFIYASNDPLRAMDEMEKILYRYGEKYVWNMVSVYNAIYHSPKRDWKHASPFLESLREQVIEWFNTEPDQRKHEYPLSKKQIKGAYKWVKNSRRIERVT